MIICPVCGAELEDGTLVCPLCGADLSDVKPEEDK